METVPPDPELAHCGLRVYVCVHAYACRLLYVCVCVFASVCMCKYMCLCVSVRVYIYI